MENAKCLIIRQFFMYNLKDVAGYQMSVVFIFYWIYEKNDVLSLNVSIYNCSGRYGNEKLYSQHLFKLMTKIMPI